MLPSHEGLGWDLISKAGTHSFREPPKGIVDKSSEYSFRIELNLKPWDAGPIVLDVEPEYY